MIALRVVQGVTKHFVGRWPEWVLSIILFCLGAKMLSSIDVFGSSPAAFKVMADFASEEHWGFFLCTIAGLRLIALAINGTFKTFARMSPVIRCGLGFLSGLAWFSIALGLFLANPEGTGHVTYTGLLIADMMNAALAGGDAGAVERKHRNGSAG